MSTAIPVATSHLTKVFGVGHTTVHAVDDVSLQVLPGELVLVMGPSGSGKTTLLSMIGGLLQPSSGRVTIDGVDITILSQTQLADVRAAKIGFVFQSFNLLASLTAEDNVVFPAHLIPGGIRTARRRAIELLERLGLGARRAFLPRDLSGGEKQRVALARALVNDPPVILADEPTGNLDSQRGQEVLMIMHDLARDEGRAVLMVTHDSRAEDVADRILWLEDGALRDRKAERHELVRDPVCGMRVDEWILSITLEHEGRRYAFCSDRCRKRFESDPAAWIGEGQRWSRATPAVPEDR